MEIREIEDINATMKKIGIFSSNQHGWTIF